MPGLCDARRHGDLAACGPEPPDIGDDLRHRLIVLRRDIGIHLHPVQRPGERRIGHHRHVVRLRRLADAGGQRIDPLRHHPRRGMLRPIVGQRHGVVGRVGDHHGRLRHRRHHAPAGTEGADLPQPRLHPRIALGLLLLLLDVVAAHAQAAHVAQHDPGDSPAPRSPPVPRAPPAVTCSTGRRGAGEQLVRVAERRQQQPRQVGQQHPPQDDADAPRSWPPTCRPRPGFPAPAAASGRPAG